MSPLYLVNPSIAMVKTKEMNYNRVENYLRRHQGIIPSGSVGHTHYFVETGLAGIEAVNMGTRAPRSPPAL